MQIKFGCQSTRIQREKLSAVTSKCVCKLLSERGRVGEDQRTFTSANVCVCVCDGLLLCVSLTSLKLYQFLSVCPHSPHHWLPASYEDILGQNIYIFFLAASQTSKQSASSGGSGFAYFNVQIRHRFPPPWKKLQVVVFTEINPLK